MRVLFVSPTYVTKDTAKSFEKHVQSIDAQTGDYLHVIVDDCSEEPVMVEESDKRVVVKSEKREGSPLASAMKGVKAHAKPDDIVAIVDGDDWLVTDNVVQVLDSVYKTGVEAAWSNYMCSDGTPGTCQWLPEIVHPRDQWFTSHLKTFKASVLDRVDDNSLRNGDGNYVKFAGDCALYWSILEKTYKRCFIPLFMYGYNVTNPLSERRIDNDEVSKYTEMLKGRRGDVRGQPTKRGVIDTGRACNEKCAFCYYAKEVTGRKFIPIEGLKRVVDSLCDNGRTTVDLTGGEPSIHPNITDLVDYIHTKKMKVCMITNGQKGFDFGCDDYLVSLHGTQETHDKLVGKPGAYDILMNGVRKLPLKGQSFRFNCVINKENKDELVAIAEVMGSLNPKIVNFINFNPYYNWSKGYAEEIQAQYSDFTTQLSEAIDLLVAKGIGVNVRYLPFCQLKGKERHICNIMQHVFDDYEWLSKDMDIEKAVGYANGMRLANNDVQNRVCAVCALQEICDGVNKQYAGRFGYGELKPYTDRHRHGVLDVIKYRFLYDEVFVR